MRRICVLLLTASLAAACDRLGIFQNQETKKESHLMAVAVEYPEGYSWRENVLFGDENAKLVIYRDWIPQSSIDVGPQACVSADPDMHRIIDGSLFTDYFADGQTIIGRDGKELFRYSARERMADIQVEDSVVFTLGEDRGGNGFSFRRNGEIILDSPQGQLLGGFHRDGGKLCFAYKVRIASGQDAYRYYVAKDGLPQQIVPPNDITEITAVMLRGGKVNYLARSSSIDGVVWQDGQDALVLGRGNGDGLSNPSFVEAGGDLYARMEYRIRSDETGSLLWKRDTLKYMTSGIGSIYSICRNEEQLCLACTRGGRSSPVCVIYKERADTVDADLSMLMPGAFHCDSRSYFLGLNDRKNGYVPVVRHGKDTVRFNFNGYFTCFSLQ